MGALVSPIGLKLQSLLDLHDRHVRTSAGPVLSEVIGDGLLYARNPYYRRVRNAAAAAGFRFTSTDPGSYFGFPLASLPTLFETRTIPFRPNTPALRELETRRPGFFTLADLRVNRPVPNYLLHESAHAVAFGALFGRPLSVSSVLSDPRRVGHLLLGEAFAMAVEYFAACAIEGIEERWLFGISSYRHRTPGKAFIGTLIEAYGLDRVTWLVLAAFVLSNHLQPRITSTRLQQIRSAIPSLALPKLEGAGERKLRRTLTEVVQMSPEFQTDTTRLFLTSLGHSRDLDRLLDSNPLESIAGDPSTRKGVETLVRTLCADPIDRVSQSPSPLRASPP